MRPLLRFADGRESGGTGRRTRFRISRATVWVRVPPLARSCRPGRSRARMDESRVTIEDLTPVRKRLRIEVPAETVQAELDQALQRVGRQARLRGFRPGKAPRAVVERVFGDEVRREVLGRLVERSFFAAVEEHGLAIVGTPDLDADTLTPAPPPPHPP